MILERMTDARIEVFEEGAAVCSVSTVDRYAIHELSAVSRGIVLFEQSCILEKRCGRGCGRGRWICHVEGIVWPILSLLFGRPVS